MDEDDSINGENTHKCIFINKARQVFEKVHQKKLRESDFFLTVRLESENCDSQIEGFITDIGNDKTRNLFIPMSPQTEKEIHQKLSEENYAQFIENIIEIQQKNSPLFFYRKNTFQLEKIELKFMT